MNFLGQFFSILKRLGNNLRSLPINISDDIWYKDSSSNTNPISKNQALSVGAVFKAVNLISTSVGKLPLVIYKRTPNGKEKDHTHPAYNLLRYKPNSEMTAKIFKQTLMGQLLLTGSAYAYIMRDNAGVPIELIPLDANNTYPVRVNKKLWYVTKVGEQIRKMYPENVLHIRGLGWDGLNSYSVLEFAARSFEVSINGQKYITKFYENAARPSVILEHPQSFTDEKAINRLRKQWKKLYTGIDNAHKTVILEQGMKANVLSLSARDSQLIESQQFALTDIANWFNIPPHKLGENTRSAYNSIEAENQSFLDECLDNWLITWEEECRDKLLTEREKSEDSRIVEFMRQALVRADLKARAEYYQKALAGAPWMTINEVREKENTNTDDKVYDQIILPTNNFGTLEQPQQNKQSNSHNPPLKTDQKNKKNSEIQKNFDITLELAQQALEHTRSKMLKRIRKDFANLAKKGEASKFVSDFETRHGKIIRDEIQLHAQIIESITGEENITQKTINSLMREAQG